MADEVEAHIALRIEELVRGGLSVERARAVALERFGDRAVLMRTVLQRERRLKREEWMEGLARDLRLAWRRLVREPGTSALSLTTFALGIGLTTAMFTVVDRVLLRELPYVEPERLVTIGGEDEHGNPISRLSFEDWSDLRERSRTLAGTAIYQQRDVTLVLDGRGRTFAGSLVSREFFDVLRVPFVAGRGFDEADEAAGAVVVSESLWRAALGGGRLDGVTVDADGRTLPVVGVVDDASAHPASTQVWVLFRGVRRGGGAMRNNINWSAIARLGPGVTNGQAQSDLASIAVGIRATDPASDYMYGATVTDLRSVLVSDARETIALLFGAACLVLLIGCSNVATLTLARAWRRQADMATRIALGASRARVFRQLLTEQLAIATAGGVLGVLIADLCIEGIMAFAAQRVPRAAEIGMDVPVLLFALGASLFAGVLAGLLPALRVSGADPHSLMSRRGVVRGGRRMAGAAMLAGEVALAITLLVGGGLLLRSLRNVLERDVGFTADGVAAAQVVLTPARYSEEASAAPVFWQSLLERLRADPAVTSAALANWVPTGSGGNSYLEVEGVDGRDANGAAYRVVSDGYFETMRMPMLRGRAFDATDVPTGERVAVINQMLAEKYWPDGGAVGARIRTPGMEGYVGVPWLRIIGVTTNVRHGGQESDPTSHVYVLQRQRPEHRAMHVLVRAADDRVSTAAHALESAVWSLEPQLAVETRDLGRELASLTAERRLTAGVLSFFAALALVLAATGIFGLFSYAVVQRASEFGIRLALGADRSRLVRLVLSDALRVVAVGSVVGLVAAYWLTKLLQTNLSGVTNTDPPTYVAALVVVTAGAVFAAAVPSMRAARVDPNTALRTS